MPRLSIVIPLLGDASQLDDTLVSVLENRPAHCEILVVHNRPYADPYGLAGEVRFIEAPRGAKMAECLNLGLRASRAAVVHVLTCGVEVTSGWAEQAVRHFRDAEVAAVAPLVTSSDEPSQVVSAGLGYRAEGTAWRLCQGVPVDQVDACQSELCGPDTLAAFYCKSTLAAIGGFPTHSTDTLTGIDTALAIRQAGFRCVLEPSCQARVQHHAVRPRRAIRRGRDAERLFWRWASAHGLFRSVAGHAALVAGECVIGLWRPLLLLQLLGRVWGAIHLISSRIRSKPSETGVAEDPAVISMTEYEPDVCHRPQRSSNAA
ncbi:MAG: glycosyltransferase [Thermoguttaceae bacterium]